MADERQMRRTMRRLERVKTWQLIVVCILMGFISATFLRLNNVKMLQVREMVVSADKAGDSQGVQNRLYELQQFSTRHMNASTGDVYLTGEYERRSQELLNEAGNGDASSTESELFKQGDAECRGGAAYTPYTPYALCVAAYIQAHTGNVDNAGVTTIKYPNPDLYRHSFVSPVWSPDFAGFSVLLTGVVLLIIIARIIIWATLKLLLKRRYRHA